ncbi:50S ribosomal protein L9 [Candidatus Portiera aleyrodidarum]|uniref:Large ribosomal subunit protein bL9 n=1 Tax=Candidatus Portiera aleyrodidarum TV TaxID=1297582 RepID=A0A8D3X6Z7_9GAMM|nr:50S ribosomal protein L9 [Candidatus Portiera aleyrodidarum]AGI27151.1 ribosomal protein L9 [Candidatus Portiera aleyrodidarum TV]CEI59127.1 50S ribosomal protein L9 [Candidatus Portiera aleyrodidarum]
MKVILIDKNIKSGKKGDIVHVNKGYARNYLIRKGLAIIAKKKNIEFFYEKRNDFLNEYKLHINKIKKKLKTLNIELFCKSGPTGNLFGSIGRRYLSKKIYEKYGIQINKNQIKINKNIIKKIGEYKIKLYEKINIKINIKRLKINEKNN